MTEQLPAGRAAHANVWAMNTPDELEPSYTESVRLFNTRRRAANREAWSEYHRDQAQRHRAVLEALIDRHEAEAERLQATDERKSA